MTYQEFAADEKTQHAVFKCAEVIGEAAKKILEADRSFDAQNRDLQFKEAARFRDRLAHGYGNINLEIVWTTVTTAIPITVAAAKEVLARRT